MRVLHIFKNTSDKIYIPFIDFINEKFKTDDHNFVIEKYVDRSEDNLMADNVEFVNRYTYVKLIKRLYASDKIILHALMSPRLTFILFFQPWLLKKCYWAIWGADLYYHEFRVKNFKSTIYEFFRKTVISHIGSMITQIQGDYELAKVWYGAKGKYHYSFMYPSNTFKSYSNKKDKENDSCLVIQVGNSADPGNNHLEVLNKLAKYRDEEIEIICPLSYGGKEYANQVISFGKNIFGNKFKAITEFIPFEGYLDMLWKIDIAIFNHNRQQAMGNIIKLLGLGKKVYIRTEITTWQFCIDHDLKVYSANSDFEDLFVEMFEKQKQKNIENVMRGFSVEKLVDDWKKIFNEGECK